MEAVVKEIAGTRLPVSAEYNLERREYNAKIAHSCQCYTMGWSKGGFQVGSSCPTTFQNIRMKLQKLDSVPNKGRQNVRVFQKKALAVKPVN